MIDLVTSTEIEPYYMSFAEQFAYSMSVYADFIDDRMPAPNLGLSEEILPERLERLFRQSFPQSNGSPLIQFLLQATAIRVMEIDLGSFDPIVEAIDAIDLDPTKFYPPRAHVGIDGDAIDRRIREIWDIFVDITHNVHSMADVQQNEEMSNQDWEWLVNYSETNMQHFLLASDMCLRDYEWLTKEEGEGRPHRKSDKAKYQSFFRTYILGGQTTGSPELDIVNGLTRETAMYMFDGDNPVPTSHVYRSFYINYIMLARKWEEIHGKQFAPPEVDRFLGKQMLTGLIEGDDWRLITKE